MTGKPDIYQSVTDAIIEAIEAGHTADKFQMPWTGFNSIPMNARTQKPYRGVNVPVLWAHQLKHGYKSGLWATYKQWHETGAQIRKGEKAARVVFWKSISREPASDNSESETRLFSLFFP